MKYRLLEFIQCPGCRSSLTLLDAVVERAGAAPPASVSPCRGRCPFPARHEAPRDCAACLAHEVTEGTLHCEACGRRYPVQAGVPRLLAADPREGARPVGRTANSYGYLWGRSRLEARDGDSRPYHFEVMARALGLTPPSGLVLDAGCGEGLDLIRQGARTGVEIVGVELSDGGCRKSFRRTRHQPTTHVVQADLRRLPFPNDLFDFVYSYGVLHHLDAPPEGVRELERVLRPEAPLAAYVYEDFSGRARGWRWLLHAVTALRCLTTRLPHRLLYVLCQVASPLVYATFTVPFLVSRRVPGLRAVAGGLPFRHARGPRDLVGDLYDRFGAPVEWRFSQAGAETLIRSACLRVVSSAYDRGWMVGAVKPGEGRAPTATAPRAANAAQRGKA